MKSKMYNEQTVFPHPTKEQIVYKYQLQPDNAHLGLKGISRYVSKHKPQMHLFGHYHQRAVYKKRGTLSICVYGVEIQYFME